MEILQFSGGAVENKIMHDNIPQDLVVWTCTLMNITELCNKYAVSIRMNLHTMSTKSQKRVFENKFRLPFRGDGKKNLP